MIFKEVGGVSPPEVGQLWQSSSAHSENVTDTLDTTKNYPSHYKNRIVMNWQVFNPQEVREVWTICVKCNIDICVLYVARNYMNAKFRNSAHWERNINYLLTTVNYEFYKKQNWSIVCYKERRSIVIQTSVNVASFGCIISFLSNLARSPNSIYVPCSYDSSIRSGHWMHIYVNSVRHQRRSWLLSHICCAGK